MRIAYFNCQSGIAGDMILAACINAGLNRAALERKLKQALKFKGWSLKTSVTTRNHFPAHMVTVEGDKHFGSPGEMKRIISKSTLPARVKEKSLEILGVLVAAESRVHRVPEKKVHFHELNSIDTLIDITGSCLAFELLNIDKIYASPLNTGRPAPATLEILRRFKVPVYAKDSSHELATPTGTAIISQAASAFGSMPLISVQASGYGAGTAVIEHSPNTLNLIIGQASAEPAFEYGRDETVILETNIDDMDPRIYPHVMDKLLSQGAKDTWLTQVLMKKGRPGIVLSVLCPPEKENGIVTVIFEETTTLGIRRLPCARHILKRTLEPGRKLACLKNGVLKIKSEFRDARSKAIRESKPLKHILY